MAKSLCGNLSNVTNDSTLWMKTMSEFDMYKRFNYPKHIFEKCVTPIMYALGCPGNLLSFLIWIRPRMRQSSGCYLAALGLGNLFSLLLHLPYYLTLSWNIQFIDNPVLCEGYPYLSLAFQYLSPLLVLGFTVERYISICHPFSREKLCTQKRALIVVCLTYFAVFVLCAIQSYFWRYDYERRMCDIRKIVLYGNTMSFWSIWTWITELLIFFVVPLAVLVFNILVIREIKKISKSERQLVRDGTTERKSATTFMLLAVSFYLIVTTLPIAIMYAAQVAFPPGSKEMQCPAHLYADAAWRAHMSFVLLRSVIQMIGLSHYSFNFYIYLITGKLFRREVVMFLCGKCSNKFSRERMRAYGNLSTKSANGDVTMYTMVNDGGANSKLTAS